MRRLAWTLVILALAGTGWMVARSFRDREPARRTETSQPISGERRPDPAPPADVEAAETDDGAPPATQPAQVEPSRPKPYRVVERIGDPERAALRVRALDEAGRGVADAEVGLTLSIDGVGTSGPRAKSDAAGEARFETLKAEEVIAVNVTIGDVCRSSLLRLQNGCLTEIVVRFRGGGNTVHGTIRDAQSGPIPFVMVALSRSTEDGFTDRIYAHTDKDGAWAMDAVPPGEYGMRISGGPSTRTVTVTSDGTTSAMPAGPRRIEYHEQDQGKLEVTASGPVRKDIVLGRLSIEGIVRDGATGAPVEGAEVTLQSPHWAKTGTDREGRFRVASMAPGKYTILLKKDGYALQFERDVEIREGEVARVEFTMDRAARLHIRLQDPEKRPVPGMFWIRFDRANQKGWSSNLVADAEGHILSEVVPLGAMRISADGGGWKGGPVEIEIGEGENRVVVTLERTGGAGERSLSGIVRDKQTGAAIGGVKLRIDVGMPRIVYSGEDGKFVFEDLPPRSYRLFAQRDGYGDATVKGVRIEAGKEARLDVELLPAATIHLRVTDSAGGPVAGRVFFTYAGGTPSVGRGLHLTLDEDGRASFARLPPGPYSVTVHVEGRGKASAKPTIQPGDNTLELAIGP